MSFLPLYGDRLHGRNGQASHSDVATNLSKDQPGISYMVKLATKLTIRITSLGGHLWKHTKSLFKPFLRRMIMSARSELAQEQRRFDTYLEAIQRLKRWGLDKCSPSKKRISQMISRRYSAEVIASNNDWPCRLNEHNSTPVDAKIESHQTASRPSTWPIRSPLEKGRLVIIYYCPDQGHHILHLKLNCHLRNSPIYLMVAETVCKAIKNRPDRNIDISGSNDNSPQCSALISRIHQGWLNRSSLWN